jgi:EAL domain-containing protein (putative c-di-GMP-specific phosphodiesterase class I)
VAIAFSEKDFATQIERNNRTTLMLSVLSLVIEIMVGTATSRLLTRTILRSAKAVDNVASGQVERIIQETGIEGRYVQLEITESAAVSQPEIIGQKLSRLKSLGIQICFDDFGTGYSQLGYLVQLPVDALKIDRSFVSYIGTQDKNSEIAKTILALSSSLELDATAEGVETLAQYHHLRSLGCRKFQGYLFSPPIASQDVPHFCPVMPVDEIIPTFS